MNLNLKGKVAIITGASRGIGRAIAELLGRAKAAVVVNYANQAAKAEEVVKTINQEGGSAISIQGDILSILSLLALKILCLLGVCTWAAKAHQNSLPSLYLKN
ncbi:MAG: SDR family NAD(P)-dependent oxidoreductase [Waterburya sp.]